MSNSYTDAIELLSERLDPTAWQPYGPSMCWVADDRGSSIVIQQLGVLGHAGAVFSLSLFHGAQSHTANSSLMALPETLTRLLAAMEAFAEVSRDD